MRRIEQSTLGFKRLLASSVAMIGIYGAMGGVGVAQNIRLDGLADSKGEYGSQGSVYIPLGGSLLTGSPFITVGGGFLGGNSKNGAFGGGYSIGGGDWGVRGYASVGAERSARDQQYYHVGGGMEVIFGGFGVKVNGYMPVGNKSHQIEKSSVRGVLVDKEPTGENCTPSTGCVPVPQNSCTNNNGQPRVCHMAIEVTKPSYEVMKPGFDVELSYGVNIGNVGLTASAGYYRFGQASGMTAGMEVNVPISSQLSLNIGAHGKNDDQKGLGGYGTIGVSYQFGVAGAAGRTSVVERAFSQAPRRMGNVPTQVKQGSSTIYRKNPGNATGQGLQLLPAVEVVWDQNSAGNAISEIWLIDARSASQLDDVVQRAANDAIVLVDGSFGAINTDDTVKFNNEHVGIAGGGAALGMKVSFDGGMTYTNTTYNTPGTRPTIQQADTSKDIFSANGILNPILYGIDMKGGRRGASFSNSSFIKMNAVKIWDTAQEGVYTDNITNMNLTTVSFNNTGGTAGSFNNSRNISLDNVNSYFNKTSGGFKFVQSQGINLSQVVVFTNYDYDNRSVGIRFIESQDVNLTNIGVGNFQAIGIYLTDTKNVIGSNISVIGKGDGIAIARNTDIDVNTVLSNIFLKIAATGLSSRQNSALRISAHGVRVSNVRIVDSNVEYAVEINNSRNVTISGVTITNSDDTDGAIFIDSSTNVQVGNVNVRGGNHSSIVAIEDSGSVHVKNVVFEKGYVPVGIYAGTVTNLTPGSHKDITFENISIDGALTGVMVVNGTLNELEISLKDVVIKNAKVVAFELFDRIYFKNLGGNKSISSASVCDSMINKNNGVVVDVGGASVICQ